MVLDILGLAYFDIRTFWVLNMETNRPILMELCTHTFIIIMPYFTPFHYGDCNFTPFHFGVCN